MQRPVSVCLKYLCAQLEQLLSCLRQFMGNVLIRVCQPQQNLSTRKVYNCCILSVQCDMISNQTSDLSIGVVIPARNAEDTLPVCIDALIAAGFAREFIYLVDDNSSDGTAQVALSRGVHVVTNSKNCGAAAARNTGAQSLSTDVLLFVDADVEVAKDVRQRFLDHFEVKGHDAVFGSYDDAPHRQETVSRLRNLLHHTTHQKFSGPVATFWTGLGAVRRDVFEAAGGFDAEQRMLEDIEFGLRLSAKGCTIFLDPDIQGKHWKYWDLKSMIKTDIWDRAIPWTKLLMSPLGRESVGALNVSLSGKISVLASFACAFSVLLAIFTPWTALATLLAGLSTLCLFNLEFLSCILRLDGWRQIPNATGVLLVHFLSAGLGYAAVRMRLA